ncbi:DUF1236 domain-containing protein [Mesorhizobium sp. VK24D]|uniref:DUF1236 domain-containing protein n=1 Tax=Mesorhizobium album TaxID=3072314 RepID=A0ABU4Y8E6_9HYPH|nr:DUF1236 domain-containing protein [Mesorhizobium sp. VK24D]MDX8483209.1 DUF1236 domain-containing protein [Mesorhizobium sp. VK24D]
MIALGVGCGAAMAQTESAQPSGDNNCVVGQADCQKGGKAGEKAQGKMKMQTEQKAQGKAGANTEEQAQGKAKMQSTEQAQGKTKMKTTEQAQGQAGTSTEEQAQGTAKCKTGMANCPKGKANEQAQGKTKMKTTEQNAQSKTGTTTEQNAQGTTKMQTQQNAQGKTGTTTQQNAQGTAKVQTDQDKTASINNVTVEQKTQITQIIHETHVQPVASVDFDISVGVQIPRHKIRLHRLPARIVKIVPAYVDFEYFVLADGRIIIVDPDTFEIVAILEA